MNIADPDLTLKFLGASEMTENDGIYSGCM